MGGLSGADKIDSHQKHDQQVFALLIDDLYKHARVTVSVSLLIAIFVLFNLWQELNMIGLLPWGIGMGIVILYRVATQVYYHYYRPRHPPLFWARIYGIAMLISGIAWGILVLLVMDHGELYATIFVVILILGLVSSTVAPLSAHLPSFFAFSLPTMSCLTLGFLQWQVPYTMSLAALSVAYWLALSGYTVIIARSTRRAHSLSLENQELVEQLQYKVREEAAANKAKSRFLAAASHDLRQPLAAMNLYLGVLEQIDSKEKIREVIAQLNNSLGALGRLLNSLLDISRLEAGIVTPDIHRFELTDLLLQLCNDYRLQADAKGLKFRCATHRHYFVRSDPALLERILRNLLTNALRYTSTGGILVGFRKREDRLRIQVWDSGVGIDPKDQQKVFGEFVQLDNPGRNAGQGLGLGLAIVERIARLMNHPIGVDSKPGKGSVFWIDVPHDQSSALEATLHHNRPTKGNELPRLEGRAIIVVDDEAIIRRALQMLIQELGGEVLAAENGSDLMERLPAWPHQPAAIISDYRLTAGETGINVIRSIHGHYEDNTIPAIIITGDTAADKLRDVADSGFPVLHKPVDPAQIITLLQKLMG